VEDDEELRPILARHLRRQGYEVIEAAMSICRVKAAGTSCAPRPSSTLARHR
jgi:hypothetical protein